MCPSAGAALEDGPETAGAAPSDRAGGCNVGNVSLVVGGQYGHDESQIGIETCSSGGAHKVQLKLSSRQRAGVGGRHFPCHRRRQALILSLLTVYRLQVRLIGIDLAGVEWLRVDVLFSK